MTETIQYSRAEIITRSRKELKAVGPSKVLSYLLKANEAEKIEALENESGLIGSGGFGLNVTLHLTAGIDAEELLANYTGFFEDSILDCHTVILAASAGEPVLRSYLRHLLTDLVGSYDEVSGMIDVLTEMYKRRRKMPLEWTSEYLDSWWEDFSPKAG